MSCIDIFLTLVQIDSPTGHGREKEVSLFIQQFLRERNVEYSVDTFHQVFCRIEKNTPQTFLFCAHMDTVSPGKNIRPIVHDDGKITSSGDTILGADNKASLACMLQMIDDISKGLFVPQNSLEFLFTAEEEGDFPKIYEWNVSQSKANAVFIFDKANEPSIATVVSRAGYLTCFQINFTGKGSHSSKPELAQNVLLMFQTFLSFLHIGKQDDESTLNIGTIQGGEATNTVPASLFITGDFRAFSQLSLDDLEKMIWNAREKVLQDSRFPDGKIEIECTPYCKGYEHDISSDFFKKLESCYASLGYSELRCVQTQSGSDASFFMHLPTPIPAFCLGDGCFAIHTVKEYTTKENLLELLKIMKVIANEG